MSEYVKKGKNTSKGVFLTQKSILTIGIIFLIVAVAFVLVGNSSDNDVKTKDTNPLASAIGNQIGNTVSTDSASTAQVLEEMSLKFQNPELEYKFYPEGNHVQYVPLSEIPSRIILRNLLITDFHVEDDYLVGYVSNLNDDQSIMKSEPMSFRYIGMDGNNLNVYWVIQTLVPANEIEAEHFSLGASTLNTPNGIDNVQFKTKIPEQAIIVWIQ